MKKICSFLLRHELLIMILCLVCFLRLPSLMEPYWYGDEAIYLTLGTGVRHGLVLYRDIHDNKPPLIYFTAAIAGSLFWFRFILLFWNLATIIVFWWIAHILFDALHPPKPFKIAGVDFPKPTKAIAATLLFALLQFRFEGNIANGEIFMILPTLVGFALLLRAYWKRATLKAPGRAMQLLLTFASGVAFSLGFLFKVPVLFDTAAAGFFFFILMVLTTKKRPIQLKQFIRPDILVFGVAFILPIALSIGYYASRNALAPYLNAALLQNVGYLGSWKTGTQAASNVGSSGLKGRLLVLVLAITGLSASALVLPAEVVLIVLWFACALFGSLLSERPYPHYLVELLPAFCLLVLLPFKAWAHKQLLGKLLSFGWILVAVAILSYSYLTIRFWSYPLLPYYEHYMQFVTGRLSRQQYLATFDPTLPEQYDVSSFIVSHTGPNDRIFVWGDLPNIYALTRRLPPGRYTSKYHIDDFNGKAETIQAIQDHPPVFIVIDKRIPPFMELTPILSHYILISDSPLFEVYHLAL